MCGRSCGMRVPAVVFSDGKRGRMDGVAKIFFTGE
jgi:hypothetical protein